MIRILQHLPWHLTPLVLVVACGPIMAADVVIVRPKAWQTAVQPWRDYRESQGYDIEEVDAELGREGISRAIKSLADASQGALQFVVLAGDSVSQDLPHGISPFYHQSTALVQFGGDPMIASDNDYGDLDGDHSPELAVGRIPARTAGQLAASLQRSIEYERLHDFGTWRRNVHVVAGVGGFGAVADSVIEMTTRRFLAERIPGWSQLTMTQASLESCYCPDPLAFDTNCIERINEGGMFWVYIGHGHVKTLDYLKVEDKWLPILDESHLPNLKAHQRPPIAVFLACYTGAFDAQDESLAEQMVLSPSGPIAAIAATRVSGPYGLAVLSDGMLTHCFDSRANTLGEIFRNAKQSLLNPVNDPKTGDERSAQLSLVNALADALSPDGYSLEAERLEHAWQVSLLGDPLLRIQHPQQLEITAPASIDAGQALVVAGKAVHPGKLRIELANCRGRLPSQLRNMQVTHTTADGRTKYQERYLAANQPVIVLDESLCVAGDFSRSLDVPAELEQGKYCIRVMQECDDSWHVAYRELRVRKPRK